MRRQRAGKGRRNATGTRKRKTHLSVERLEDRCLLDAGIAAELRHPVELAVVPNDPRFPEMYNLNNTGGSGRTADADIDAPEAWNTTTGSLRTVVGIVDTGIDYRHVDLYKNIWINQAEIPSAVRSRLLDVDSDGRITFWDLNDSRNQGAGKITDLNRNGRIDGGDLLYSSSQGGWANGISEDGDRFVDDLIGWNFANNTNNPFDDNRHGTHVAGTIGAMGNNAVGVTGINWKVQLMALKFLDSNGSGTLGGAIDALNYSVAKGAHISNHSWTIGSYYSQQLYDAINAARSRGHIVVAAAANGGADGVGDNNDVTPAYPASFALDNVVAVAASGATDRLASFSNYGATSVDLAAPGVSILSTTPNNTYSFFSGTSMATPHVTGVIALVQSLHPSWSYSQKIQQVLGTVDRISALDGKVRTGGRLNAARAVGATVPGPSGPRIVSATPNATGSAPVQRLRVTFDRAINPSTFTVADILAFTGPRENLQARSVTVVAGSGNKVFDITFAVLRTPGTYRITIGSEIWDTAGNRMAAGQYVATFTIRSGSSGNTTATAVSESDISDSDFPAEAFLHGDLQRQTEEAANGRQIAPRGPKDIGSQGTTSLRPATSASLVDHLFARVKRNGATALEQACSLDSLLAFFSARQ